MITKSKRVRKPIFMILLKRVAVLSLLCYSVAILISQQITISKKQKEIDNMNARIAIEQQKNDEYSRLLSMADSEKFMEKVATEKLGYAYPNEIRYYDTSLN